MKGRYISYLLRLWETTDGEQHIWHTTLESPAGGERYSFASLAELLTFLESAMQAEANSAAGQAAQLQAAAVQPAPAGPQLLYQDDPGDS
jgi:hypothetical protein